MFANHASPNSRFGPVLALAIIVLALGLGDGAEARANATAPAVVTASAPILLPGSFPGGWIRDGAPETYSPKNLYEYINGEAELYLPYGFETLVTARYRAEGKPGANLTIDLYRMGSPLDAFGVYSQYRHADGETVNIGAEGEISDYQVLFFQDRYLVRIAVSASGTPARESLLVSGKEISGLLAPPAGLPPEVALMQPPEITPRTEKYLAESLLGYKFFSRGLTAEGIVADKPVKFFVVLTESAAAARATLDAYLESLRKDGVPLPGDAATSDLLQVRDPLYKGVVIRLTGSHLVGIAKLEDPEKGLAAIASWAAALPR